MCIKWWWNCLKMKFYGLITDWKLQGTGTNPKWSSDSRTSSTVYANAVSTGCVFVFGGQKVVQVRYQKVPGVVPILFLVLAAFSSTCSYFWRVITFTFSEAHYFRVVETWMYHIFIPWLMVLLLHCNCKHTLYWYIKQAYSHF